MLLVAPGITTRNKKLLGARPLLFVSMCFFFRELSQSPWTTLGRTLVMRLAWTPSVVVALCGFTLFEKTSEKEN